MSFKAVEWVLEQPELQLAERMVMVVLAEYAAPDGVKIFPALSTVARRSGLSERHVRRIIRQLEEKNWLRRGELRTPTEGAFKGRTDRATYEYTILMHERGDIMSARTERGDNHDTNGGTSVTERGDIVMSADLKERSDKRDLKETPIVPLQGDGTANLFPNGKAQKPEPETTPEGLVAQWNEAAKRHDLVAVEVFSASRRKKVVARLAEHPDKAFWERVFREIDGSQFLRGYVKPKDGSAPWEVDFDWLIRNDTNCVKIVEGHY